MLVFFYFLVSCFGFTVVVFEVLQRQKRFIGGRPRTVIGIVQSVPPIVARATDTVNIIRRIINHVLVGTMMPVTLIRTLTGLNNVVITTDNRLDTATGLS